MESDGFQLVKRKKGRRAPSKVIKSQPKDSIEGNEVMVCSDTAVIRLEKCRYLYHLIDFYYLSQSRSIFSRVPKVQGIGKKKDMHGCQTLQ